MKILIALLFLLASTLLGCEQQKRYEVREVHDILGDKAFIRINISNGSICTLGEGYVVSVDFSPKYGINNSPNLPFCTKEEQ